MPKIFPFKAVRYQLPSNRLKLAVCPPYDVIGEALEKKLKRNPLNAIQVELPSGDKNRKYQNAKKVWQSWIKAGKVRADVEPSFYIYEQLFTVEGKRYARKGFFCELEVEKPGKGSVLRHEFTLAGPKVDRFNLIKTVRVNTSPIFGLFKDSGKKVENILKRYAKKKPEAEFKDYDGVTHRLWLCSDPAEIRTIAQKLASTPAVIADGHHRYETSWNYAKAMEGSRFEGVRRTLFFLCPMEDPGLVIFPTHRIVRVKSGHKQPTLGDARQRVASLPNLFEILAPKPAPKAGSYSFQVTDGKDSFFVRVKSQDALKKKLGKKPQAYLDLPLVHLHLCLLPEYEKEDFIYSHDDAEAVSLAKKQKTIAFLVPATSTEELYQVVSHGEVMPQKSTYFYPKIITGLIFRSIE